MITEPLRRKWAAGQPTINGWCSIGNPFTAEIMAAQGYDSVTIDVQHGALDYGDALSMLQAMRGSGVVPFARAAWRDGPSVMKVLDAGAMGVICPMINSAAEAAEFASFMRYPPRGQRSFGPTRAGVAMPGYGVQVNEDVLAFAMIETAEGMANLDAIAATPGIDGLYIGPADLTLGVTRGRLPPGFDRTEEEMVTAIQTILGAARRHGRFAALHCATPDYAAKAAGWGFDMLTVSADARILAAGARAMVERFRTLTKDTPTR